MGSFSGMSAKLKINLTLPYVVYPHLTLPKCLALALHEHHITSRHPFYTL